MEMPPQAPHLVPFLRPPPPDDAALVYTIGHAAPAPPAPASEQVSAALMEASLFAWPVPPAAINSLFGERRDPLHQNRLRFHYGVDLEANYGAIIHATAGGLVLEAGWHAGHGRSVLIQHANGYRSRYAHLSQVIAVRGQHLNAGQPVGLVGNSGHSTGPHLHFEVYKDGIAIDPLRILRDEP